MEIPKCEVRRASVTTLLAIPVGAYKFGEACGRDATASVTPKPSSAFNKPIMFMCSECLEEAKRKLGETINIKTITKDTNDHTDIHS